MNARLQIVCLCVAILTATGCAPRMTATVTPGACARFILPSVAHRKADNGLFLDDEGSEASGRVTLMGDADDNPQRYRLSGPATLHLGVRRSGGNTELDLSLPAGTEVILTDMRSEVRCEIATQVTADHSAEAQPEIP